MEEEDIEDMVIIPIAHIPGVDLEDVEVIGENQPDLIPTAMRFFNKGAI